MSKEISYETACQIARRIWCDQEYSHMEINVELAHKIAKMLQNESIVQELNDSVE